MIIGLVGLGGSGKGTITAYVTKKYGAKTVKFSQPLRDIIHRMYKQETRDDMADLAEFLRRHYGNDILVQTLMKDLEKMDIDIVVFDGIRYADEFNALKKRKDFVLWSVDAEIKTRFDRIHIRGENADDSTLTFDAFKQQHELPTEKPIPGIMKQADFALDNNGTLDELYSQVDSLVEKSRDAIKD